jgi:hypothetical protein
LDTVGETEGRGGPGSHQAHQADVEDEGEQQAEAGRYASATASTTGWIEAQAGGPECLFCGEAPRAFKPLDEGSLTTLERLWWCRPCETTWVA